MTTRDLAGTLDAVANRWHVTPASRTAWRRSALVEAQTLVQLEGEVDRVVRLVRSVQPKGKAERSRSGDSPVVYAAQQVGRKGSPI